MKTIGDVLVTGRRVLVRADLNVPLDGTRITDDGRVRACLPTLNALLARGAAVVVFSGETSTDDGDGGEQPAQPAAAARAGR